MANDDLIPGGDPAPTPGPTPRATRIQCDFCGCALAPSGDVLRMSDAAKVYRDASDAVADLTAQLATVQQELSVAQAAIDEAKRVSQTLPNAQRSMFKW